MKKADLTPLVSEYNDLVSPLNVSLSFVDYLREDVSGLKEAWDTSHGKEVVSAMEKEVNTLENNLSEYKKIVDNIKSSKINLNFESITSYEYKELGE